MSEFLSFKLYGNNAYKYMKLSPLEQKNLLSQYYAGDTSVESELMEYNLGLVAYVVNRYFWWISDNDKEDFFQVGCLALHKILAGYDIETGNAFSSYAIPMLYGEMRRYLRDNNSIRYPRSIKDIANKIKSHNLYDLSVSEISERLDALEEDVKGALILLSGTVSIDYPIDTSKKHFVSDLIPSSDNIEQEYEQKEEKIELRQLMKFISNRDAEVISLYYGIDCEKNTQMEVGEKTGLSQAQISRIVNGLPKKMRKLYESDVDLDSAFITTSIQDEFSEFDSEKLTIALKMLRQKEQNVIYAAYGINCIRLSLIEIANKYDFASVIDLYFYVLEIKKRLLSFLERKELISEIEDGGNKEIMDDKKNTVRIKRRDKEITIFDDFRGYDAQKVLDAVNNLKEKYRRIIEAWYGLNGKEKYSIEQIQAEFKCSSISSAYQIISRIRAMLRAYLDDSNNKESFSNQDEVSSSQPALIDKTDGEITKEDYLKMLELLRTPTFTQMMSMLNAKEAVIISLRLGYVDGKYFSTESIARFLGIEEEEVIETTKKVLLLYKESINGFLDKAIEAVSGKIMIKGNNKDI